MGLTPITKGYTGKITIGGNPALLTSYSLVMNSNMIKSNASINVKDTSGFTRLLLSPIHDCQNYQLSVSIELNTSVLSFLITQLTQYYFKNKITVVFTDNNFTITLSGYITNFSLSVDNDSAGVASFTLISYEETIGFTTSVFSLQTSGLAPAGIKGNSLLPYYGWGVQLGSNSTLPVQNFSLNFSHVLTPKFGCIASSSVSSPMAYVFSIPSVTYQVTFILVNSNTLSLNSNYDLTIKYKNSHKIILKECYSQSYNVSCGNSGSVNTASISGTVFGKITEKEEKK